MKLLEIALPSTGRTPGSFNQMADPNVLLSIRNVCQRGGKTPNTFELVAICRMLQMIKNGNFYKQTNPFEVNLSTSKELMDILRAMKPEDLCKVAARLSELLATKDSDAYYNLANPTQEYLMWLQWVHGREADESVEISNANSLLEAKSQKQLYQLLDEFYKTTEYSKNKLKAKGISNETYGPKSFIYITTKSREERKQLEQFLKTKGFSPKLDYHPGSSIVEVQVSYFKGDRWDV